MADNTTLHASFPRDKNVGNFQYFINTAVLQGASYYMFSGVSAGERLAQSKALHRQIFHKSAGCSLRDVTDLHSDRHGVIVSVPLKFR